MKVINVVLGILFVTATLQAQIPLYPYMYPQPYIYSQMYYPGPYFAGPYLSLSPFAAPNQYAMYYAGEIWNANVVPDNGVPNNGNALTNQVQQLRSEIHQLGSELATAQVQVSPAPKRPSMPTILVFNNGAWAETRGYVIAGERLLFLTQSGFLSVKLSDLDIEATQCENLKRGMHFPTPNGSS